MKKFSFILISLLFLFLKTETNAYLVLPLPTQTKATILSFNTNYSTILANPYPSIITVSNLPTKIASLSLGLTLSASIYSTYIDILLEGPQGQTCLLLSDVGNNTVNNLPLTISDDAPSAMPTPVIALDLGDPFFTLNYGSFRPTDGGFFSDNFPEPASQKKPYPASLAGFKDINPNGEWKLYMTRPPMAIPPPYLYNISKWELIFDIYPQNDYTGDGVSDYVLKKGKYVFIVTETNITPITQTTPPAAFVKAKIIGGADLDGDHISDLIIKKGSTIQGLKGPSFFSTTHTLNVKGIKPVASGDFNGDLLPDLYFQRKTSLFVAINTGTYFEFPQAVAINTLPKKFKVFGALSGAPQATLLAQNKTIIARLDGPNFSNPIGLTQTANSRVKAAATGQFTFAADNTGPSSLFQQKNVISFSAPSHPGVFKILQINQLKGLKIVAPR